MMETDQYMLKTDQYVQASMFRPVCWRKTSRLMGAQPVEHGLRALLIPGTDVSVSELPVLMNQLPVHLFFI